MNLLTVNGLTKHFGSRAVLRNVSFSVRQGEVLGLIGPNGAGKTTLFECLAGILPDDGGAISADGQRLVLTRRKTALFYLPDGVTPWAQQSVDWATGFFDKCAGILFNLKPNGDYLTVRFNGNEDNLVLWTFNKGARKFVKKGVENMPLELNKWHEIKIAVHGTQLEGWLNGKHLLDYTLAEPVSGKVGLWSKTDSVSYFDEFTVTPAPK
jgi:energy-coupling factor transporter ATP-binding protein EcfA2